MNPVIPVSTILINPVTNWDINPQSEEVIPEIPGDLGSQGLTLNWLSLLQDSLRLNSLSNLGYPTNHRYAGHRESVKFNLILQQTQMQLALNSNQIIASNAPLVVDELSYISNADLAALNHIREQCIFNEWLILKDQSTFWF